MNKWIDEIFSYIENYITDWWMSLSDSEKWALLGFLILSLFIFWVIGKIINTIVKFVLFGVITGVLLYFLTENTGFWEIVYPKWGDYTFFERVLSVFILGLILYILFFLLHKVSRTTLFRSPYHSPSHYDSSDMKRKRCLQKGGFYDEIHDICELRRE